MNIHLTGVSSLVEAEGKQRFKSFPSASSEKVRFPPLPLPHHWQWETLYVVRLVERLICKAPDTRALPLLPSQISGWVPPRR